MKIKKIKVPKYLHKDEFGSIWLRDIEILLDASETDVSADKFDQAKHPHFLSSVEIERISKISAQRFFDENATALLGERKQISPAEISGIKNFLKISGLDLGTLIGLDKSSVSRILSGKQDLQRDKLLLLIKTLEDELEHPGKAKILLFHLRKSSADHESIERIDLSAKQVAEFFIRRFHDTDGPITHLKLQKLLYYSQGMAFSKSKRLIKENFKAWQHGPVVEEVYDLYKQYEKNPLPINDGLNLTKLEGNETVMGILEETISIYGLYDAWYLRDKTHKEAPWAETAQGEVIPELKMIAFFQSVLI